MLANSVACLEWIRGDYGIDRWVDGHYLSIKARPYEILSAKEAKIRLKTVEENS
jgi:hypothetical protein